MVRDHLSSKTVLVVFSILFIFAICTLTSNAQNCNARFYVQLGPLAGYQEVLQFSGTDMKFPLLEPMWSQYDTLYIKVVVDSNAFKKYKGKWLGMTLRQGDGYVDVPAVKMKNQSTVFELNYSRFAHKFSTGDYEVTVAIWRDYDSESDQMIGELWRLNWEGNDWMPLITYTNFYE